jgi:uncharacterized protein (TIGR02145 family)
VKNSFAGALVYHTGGNSIPAGVYLWNGTNWSPATENCVAPALTLSVPPFVKKDATVAFSVASDASARCAEGETYEWYRADTPGGVAGTSFGSGAGASTSFASVGSYKVKVEAASPYSSSAIVEEKEISVTADGGPAPNMLTYTYGIVGETCLDVKKTGQDKAAVYADRKDGFPDDNFTKTYKFVHGNNYTELSLSLDDPDHLVAGITYPPLSATGNSLKEFTVTFKPEVRELAAAAPLTVKLYASYKPAATPAETRYAYLEIRVEDGTCICPAKVSGTQWLNFMCHNLGGIDIISPSQLITYEHHGDWYRFGAKNPSLVNTGTNNAAVTNWTTASHPDYPFYNESADWPDNHADPAFGNPCPAGWRLPTWGEWENVRNNNYANVPAATWSSGETVFSNLKKLGDDLMFPAAGWRVYSTGSLDGRGIGGYYWSSTGDGTSNGWYVYFNSGSPGVGHTARSYGFSVRCVQAE